MKRIWFYLIFVVSLFLVGYGTYDYFNEAVFAKDCEPTMKCLVFLVIGTIGFIALTTVKENPNTHENPDEEKKEESC